MKTLLQVLAALLLLAAPASAQTLVGGGSSLGVGSTPIIGTCANGNFIFNNAGLVGCSAAASSIAFPQAVTGGVSGGLPYFSTGSQLSASAALTAGSLVVGGGAGAAPASVTLGGDCSFSSPNVTCSKVNGVAYPSAPSTNTVAVVTGVNTATYEAVPNTALANSSLTLSGHSVSLGGTLALSASDVALGNVTNDVQTKAAVIPNTTPAAGGLLVGNAGATAYAPVAASGDATIASTGAVTVTKTGGVAFAPSATTDTTNAANIASGLLATARGGVSQASIVGSSWTPAFSATTGTLTSITLNTANFIKVGHLVFFTVDVTITSAGTAAGSFIFTTPSGIAQVGQCTGQELASTGKMLNGSINTGTSIGIRFYDFTTPIASGNHVVVGGWYSE